MQPVNDETKLHDLIENFFKKHLTVGIPKTETRSILNMYKARVLESVAANNPVNDPSFVKHCSSLPPQAPNM